MGLLHIMKMITIIKELDLSQLMGVDFVKGCFSFAVNEF